MPSLPRYGWPNSWPIFALMDRFGPALLKRFNCHPELAKDPPYSREILRFAQNDRGGGLPMISTKPYGPSMTRDDQAVTQIPAFGILHPLAKVVFTNHP